MLVLVKQAGVVLLVVLSTLSSSNHLAGQERGGPIDVLMTFVREDVRKSVPPEMKPYNIRGMFLRVIPEAARNSALGSLEKENLSRLGVALVDDTARMLVHDQVGSGGSYVRDDGVYVTVSSVDKVEQGGLAVTFSYFVTYRRPGERPKICLQEKRLMLRPSGAGGGAGWEISEVKSIGHC